MQMVSSRLDGQGIDVLRLDSKDATITRAKDEMPSHQFIHLACHAVQDTKQPLQSGFHLHDGRLELADIMSLNLPSAQFAFLSACQTSMGDERLSEEAVHLAAGMLAAGYRSVVATMWSIKDQHAPLVAEDFYAHLLEKIPVGEGGQRLQCTETAYALDHAIQNLRQRLGDNEDSLLAWVPYVHFGV